MPSATEARANELAQIAAQLAGRIRDDDPEDVGTWLRKVAPTHQDVFELCFVLAAAMPIDVSFTRLTAWTDEDGDPVINQRRAILLATAPRTKRFDLGPHKDAVVDMRQRGLSYGRIADALGCDKSTIAKFCRANELAAA